MLRGRKGDDFLFGCYMNDPSGESSICGGSEGNWWAYGDEGNDVIWGKNSVQGEYIWGGEGHDEIHGGNRNQDTFINGNDGDDVIYPGNAPQS